MKSSISKITAIVMTGLLTLTSLTPAQAQETQLSFGQRKQVVQSYCQSAPQDWNCSGYWFWGDREYDAFYYRNRSNLEPLVAGILGLAIGAIIAGAIANGNKRAPAANPAPTRLDRGHVARCYARYKSYDERTDTFMGYDGYRHPCNL